MSKLRNFTVRGSLYFPIDMLRYDQCWPADHDSVDAMHVSLSEATEVSVTLCSTRPPTTGRWESFGWRVTEGDVAS